MSNPEYLLLHGADNFRSLKAMPTRCGRRIGAHSLLRTDQLHRLNTPWPTGVAKYLAGDLGRRPGHDPRRFPLRQSNSQQYQSAADRVIQVQCFPQQHNRQYRGK